MENRNKQNKVDFDLKSNRFFIFLTLDLQGNQVKESAVSTITKSLPIEFSTLVNYSLLADLGYINLFLQKIIIFRRIRVGLNYHSVF